MRIESSNPELFREIIENIQCIEDIFSNIRYIEAQSDIENKEDIAQLKLEAQKLLNQLNAFTFEELQSASPALLHIAAVMDSSLDVMKILVSKGFEVNKKIEFPQIGIKTPMDLAVLMVHREVMDYLMSVGGVTDIKVNKISEVELNNLIANAPEDITLNIANELEALGFDKDISYLDVYIPRSNIDFSNLDMSECDITVRNAENIKFDYSNLTNASIDGVHISSSFSFNGAILKGFDAMMDFDTYQNAMTESQREESSVLCMPKDRYFYQFKLVSKFTKVLSDGGICHGLAREYARRMMKHKGDEAASDKFFNKLKDALMLEGEPNNFVKRVGEYLDSSYIDTEGYYEKKYYSVDLSEDFVSPNSAVQSRFLSVLPQELRDADFLDLVVVASINHSCVLRKVKDDKGDTLGYKFYDTSYGETTLIAESKLDKLIDVLMSSYALYFPGAKLYALDLGKEISKRNLVDSGDAEHFASDSKNVYKLYEAIDSQNIEEIERLSKVIKINYEGLQSSPYNEKHHTNPLSYSILYGSKESVIALLSHNDLMKLNKEHKVAVIVKDLIVGHKFEEDVIDVLKTKIDLNNHNGLKLIEEIVEFKNSLDPMDDFYSHQGELISEYFPDYITA